MIAKTIVYSCRACGSQNIVKNGHNAYGSQQYWCKDCGKRGVLKPKHNYTAKQKEQILSAYTNERSSMCYIQRGFGVSRNMLTSWLNMAEIELSALVRQCLDRRIPDIQTLSQEVQEWQRQHNDEVVKVQWQFSSTDARTKLKHLYPKISGATLH